MTVAELLERMDSRELTEWGLLFGLKHDEDEERQQGEVIEHGRDDGPNPDDDDEDDDELIDG